MWIPVQYWEKLKSQKLNVKHSTQMPEYNLFKKGAQRVSLMHTLASLDWSMCKSGVNCKAGQGVWGYIFDT